MRTITPLTAELVDGRLTLGEDMLMLGASVYTFSIILAVFLVGLGFGSSAGRNNNLAFRF